MIRNRDRNQFVATYHLLREKKKRKKKKETKEY